MRGGREKERGKWGKEGLVEREGKEKCKRRGNVKWGKRSGKLGEKWFSLIVYCL